ncbi:hypothetical protein [Pandoraea anhela]|uniref:hypothetical protein n=1 Tax=Pandoraea anhela TaxID=2508295 RepID=UPI0012425B9B|nr:hypothetical protein [Pandoraea anhela]
MAEPQLHFYSNENNDVLVRKKCFENIDSLVKQGASEELVLNAIDVFLSEIPGAAQRYSLWSNAKCPCCKKEFPYRFKGDLKLRLEDFEIVLIDGCEIDTDDGVFLVEVNPVP